MDQHNLSMNLLASFYLLSVNVINNLQKTKNGFQNFCYAVLNVVLLTLLNDYFKTIQFHWSNCAEVNFEQMHGKVKSSTVKRTSHSHAFPQP